MSQGTYYKVKPDGAKWKCPECGQYHEANYILVFENTETKERKLMCMDCVDPDWFANAKCIGEL